MDESLRQSQTRYAIPAVGPEKQRLIKQYAMKKSYYGWDQAVPNTIDVSRIHHVLDIAAGTCVWTFDFANIPEVRTRLRMAGGDKATVPIRLYACDIDTDFFPSKGVMDELGVETFQQDVTNPFPDEMYDKFDLLHISFLVICLTRDGWREALKNCHKLLKPGGMLMIDEADPVLCTDAFRPPPEEAVSYDLAHYMDGNHWVHKANRIYTAWALKEGFITDLSFSLKVLLAEAGLNVLESRRGLATHGRLCTVYTGADGTDLSEYEDFSTENMVFLLDHLSAALLRNDALQAPKGVIITADEDRKALLREIEEGLRQEGALSLGRYCIARKPEAERRRSFHSGCKCC